MGNQKNLNKVAEEFVMMEELHSQMRRMERRAQENPVQIYQPKTIDSIQAAKKYGGLMEVRPRLQQPAGVWILDYSSKRKAKVTAYSSNSMY